MREPAWWYRSEQSWPSRALSPIASVWSRAAIRRFEKGTPVDIGVPTICVGNFTAGGTGKTPLSILIGQELIRIGKSPAFLTRGYGGRTKGPHWVAPDRDTSAEVGDEPLLLARIAPTLVARDRAAGARAIVSTGAGHDVVILDDGLQNPTVAKSLAIAVVDGGRGVGNGAVIPAGPLRAPLPFQLGLVSAVVVNLGSQPLSDTGGDRTAADAPIPFVRWLRDHFGGPVISATVRPTSDTSWLAATKIIAFSGIGVPARFFELLSQLGAELVARRAFPDHHQFTENEARQLLEEARQTGATLCTTEKDGVRLPRDKSARGALREASRVLPIGLHFEPRDQLRLTSLLEASLATGRRL